MITKKYKVADCIFSIELDHNSTLWRDMIELLPFAEHTTTPSLFSLKLSYDHNGLDKELIAKVEFSSDEDEHEEFLYKIKDGYVFEYISYTDISSCYQLQLSSDFRKGVAYLVTTSINKTYLVFSRALKAMYSLNIYGLGILRFHSSCIIKDGKAILFHAKSGTGKSTQSQQWMKVFPDAELLNDDHPIVRVWPDGKVIAYGSPWSGKTPCYKNLSAPVAAFVRINRANENKIHRLSPVQAYASLMPSCTGSVKWNKEITEAQHQTLNKIIASVPCYQLDCLPNEDAARVCAAEVLKER